MIPHERRLSIRKSLEHIAYLSLPLDNGGIVLDVSEGGLRFHSIAPVRTDGPIHFRFSIDSATRITAVGELAWKDETGKTGALRFTQLSNELREQIRVWASQPKWTTKAGSTATGAGGAKPAVIDLPASAPAVAAEAAPAGNAVMAAVMDAPSAAPAVEAKVAPGDKHASLPAAISRYPAPYNSRLPIYGAPANKLSMFAPGLKSEPGSTARAVPPSDAITHPIAAVGLTIALAFLVSIGIFSYVFTSRAGELFVESMWSGFSPQQIPQDAAPPVSVQDSSTAPQQ